MTSEVIAALHGGRYRGPSIPAVLEELTKQSGSSKGSYVAT
jgi:hypothetical protein